jgi:hypothetical protein
MRRSGREKTERALARREQLLHKINRETAGLAPRSARAVRHTLRREARAAAFAYRNYK